MDAIEQAKKEASALLDAAEKLVKPSLKQRLKMVKVRDPVAFSGPSDMTLLASNGELALDPQLRLIVGTPNDPKRDACVVPLENVVFMVPLAPADAKKIDDAKAEKEKAQAELLARKAQVVAAAHTPRPAALPPGVRPPKPKGDTVKFVRGPDGKPVEVTE